MASDLIKCSVLSNHCETRSPGHLLSRKQKKRAFERRYWDNVSKNARKWLEKHRLRQAQIEDAIFAEYETIVEKEMEAMVGQPVMSPPLRPKRSKAPRVPAASDFIET